jgi:hypothetical protein
VYLHFDSWPAFLAAAGMPSEGDRRGAEAQAR